MPDPVDLERLEREHVRVVSCDAHTLVVIKPSGMATELTTDPGWTGLISKVRQAAREGVRPRLVHRLDRVTRGIVVVALVQDAASFYAEQIREGMWDKWYIARIPTPDPGAQPLHRGVVGKHKAYLKDENGRSRIVRAGGKTSLMEVLACEPAPERPGQSHALIKLLTGRLHQIRIMMAGLRLPLVGDELYGGPAGELYLEHAALRYVDCATRELNVAFARGDAEREPVSPKLIERLAREVEGAFAT